MKWKRKDKYAEVSECGCYSVCAIGGEKGWAFEAYRTRQHPEGPHLVIHNVTAQDARAACEADSLAE